MVEKTVKPLQVLVEGFNLREIMKDEFLGCLEEEFGCDVKLVNLIFSISEDDKRRLVVLSHMRPIDEEKGIVVVDAPTADNLDNIVNVIKKFG